MIRLLRNLWCDWTHSGVIKRVAQGRINWQCEKCGRWSDKPLGHNLEGAFIDAEIRLRKDLAALKEPMP